MDVLFQFQLVDLGFNLRLKLVACPAKLGQGTSDLAPDLRHLLGPEDDQGQYEDKNHFAETQIHESNDTTENLSIAVRHTARWLCGDVEIQQHSPFDSLPTTLRRASCLVFVYLGVNLRDYCVKWSNTGVFQYMEDGILRLSLTMDGWNDVLGNLSTI